MADSWNHTFFSQLQVINIALQSSTCPALWHGWDFFMCRTNQSLFFMKLVFRVGAAMFSLVWSDPWQQQSFSWLLWWTLAWSICLLLKWKAANTELMQTHAGSVCSSHVFTWLLLCCMDFPSQEHLSIRFHSFERVWSVWSCCLCQGSYAFGRVCVHACHSVCKHDSTKSFEWILIKLCRGL